MNWVGLQRIATTEKIFKCLKRPRHSRRPKKWSVLKKICPCIFKIPKLCSNCKEKILRPLKEGCYAGFNVNADVNVDAAIGVGRPK